MDDPYGIRNIIQVDASGTVGTQRSSNLNPQNAGLEISYDVQSNMILNKSIPAVIVTPTILTQPQATTAVEGGVAAFSVSVYRNFGYNCR